MDRQGETAGPEKKKWVVFPLNSQGNTVADPVYIAAKTESGAKKAGRTWLKTLGVKNFSWVSAILMERVFIRFDEEDAGAIEVTSNPASNSNVPPKDRQQTRWQQQEITNDRP